MKIGLLSDTHGWLDSKILDFFKDCDEVWHCGDIGDLAVTDRLAANFNLRAVYGNIDGGEIRTMFAPTLIFDCEGVKTVMTHIGGYPGHYDAGIRTLLYDDHLKAPASAKDAPTSGQSPVCWFPATRT